jgi:hypothetical protein
MLTEIRDILDPHKTTICEVGKGLLAGNTEAVATSLFRVALGVATASPALGALGSDVVAKIFANTATKRLEKAMADAETEAMRQALVDDISASVEALLGEFLVQLVRVQHRVKEEVVAALGGRPELADFSTSVAAGLTEYAVHVERLDVSERGIGIRVSDSGRTAFVRELHARGDASVGIEL